MFVFLDDGQPLVEIARNMKTGRHEAGFKLCSRSTGRSLCLFFWMTDNNSLRLQEIWKQDATKLETVLPPLILRVLAPSPFPHLLIQAFHTCIGSSIRWLCTLETFHTGRIPPCHPAGGAQQLWSSSSGQRVLFNNLDKILDQSKILSGWDFGLVQNFIQLCPLRNWNNPHHLPIEDEPAKPLILKGHIWIRFWTSPKSHPDKI